MNSPTLALLLLAGCRGAPEPAADIDPRHKTLVVAVAADLGRRGCQVTGIEARSLEPPPVSVHQSLIRPVLRLVA